MTDSCLAGRRRILDAVQNVACGGARTGQSSAADRRCRCWRRRARPRRSTPQLDQLNTHHHNVDAKLRRLRSDVNLSGIFVRDYLLDVAREHAPEYRERLAEFRETNMATVAELRALAERARRADSQPRGASSTNTGRRSSRSSTGRPTEKIFRSASFLRREVVPRREAVLAIAQEIEELNNANLAAQRAEVTRRQAAFRDDLRRLLWQSVLLGLVVALIAVFRLARARAAIRRAASDRRRRRAPDARALAAAGRDAGRRAEEPVTRAARPRRRRCSRRCGWSWAASSAREPPVTHASARPSPNAGQLVDQMFRTVRDLALGLRPSMLDDFGLQPALEWHVRDFTQPVRRGRRTDRRRRLRRAARSLSDVRVSGGPGSADQLRPARAGARRSTVSVTGHADRLDVSVTDDGIGLDPARRRDGLGLRGIEERVKELHGAMTIGRRDRRQGTTLDDPPAVAGAPSTEVPLARAAG